MIKAADSIVARFVKNVKTLYNNIRYNNIVISRVFLVYKLPF